MPNLHDMKVRLHEAYRFHQDGRAFLVGSFRPVVLHAGAKHLNVSEPASCAAYEPGGGAAPMPVAHWTFPIAAIGFNGRIGVLRVELTDPVEWLPDWTWRDPLWLKVWRGEAPDPFKSHIVDLATGKRAS